MPDFRPPSAPASAPSDGVLLVNLGTPSSPNAPALRAYLREFLSDPRVVDLPRVLWYPILYGVILPFRAPRSAKAYQKIWTPQGSPLRVFSQALASALAAHLAGRAQVALAMRYGAPSVASQLRAMRDAGVQRVVVVPLYPQYSVTTTASVMDAVQAANAELGASLTMRTIEEYHDDAAWIDAVAAKIREHRAKQTQPGHLLFSFHGIPQRCVDKGDPYARQCEASARAIAAALGLGEGDWSLSYQSRLGKAQWLTPYTDQTVRELAQRGVQHLDVVCPGFAVDCLETLEEIAIQNAGFFRQAGGQSLRYIPALNADPAHVAVLAALVQRHAGFCGAFVAPSENLRDSQSIDIQ